MSQRKLPREQRFIYTLKRRAAFLEFRIKETVKKNPDWTPIRDRREMNALHFAVAHLEAKYGAVELLPEVTGSPAEQTHDIVPHYSSPEAGRDVPGGSHLRRQEFDVPDVRK